MFEGDDIKDALLNDRDADALDALVESGFDRDATRAADPIATERLHKLLSTLSGPITPVDESITDFTLLRIQRASEEPALVDVDKDALDALIFAGFDPAKVSAALRPRAKRHRALADLATIDGAVSSEDLTERTLSHIELNAAPDAIPIERGRRRIRLGDLISIAAVVLIGASLILPVIGALQEQRFQSVCRSNMLASAMGLSSYAMDNEDSLPMITAGFGSKPWWSVGDPDSSNSANLYHLARAKYVAMQHLACAGNPLAPTRLADQESRDWRQLDEVSYAYRVMSGKRHPDWQAGSRVVVLADRSPVVLRSARGFAIVPDENSPNHGALGQQVLRNDGSSEWLETPELAGGDNIWLPRHIEELVHAIRSRQGVNRLSGRESPASSDDSFVGP